MDARLRNLFSRRRSQKHDQLRLRAHPYESTVKEASPTKGTRPIAGNGPYRLENVALQAHELGAEPPNILRSRRDSSYSRRPRTAPQSAQFESYVRPRSGYSTKAPAASSRHAYNSALTSPHHPPPETQRVRSVSALASESPQPHNQSTHVDILDAVTRINPSVKLLIQKRIASGKRDYGEDVADRNIEAYGGDEYPQHDACSYDTDDAAYSLDGSSQDNELQGTSDITGKLDSRHGSTGALVSRFESDTAGDDTSLQNHRTQHSASRVYSHANPEPSNFTPLTTANNHARRESGSPAYCNANGVGQKNWPGRSSAAAEPSVMPSQWSNTITSANPYYMRRGLNHAVSSHQSILDSSQPTRRTNESRGTQTTPSPPEPIIIPSVIPVKAYSQHNTESSGSDSDSDDPPPILRSRLSRRIILPTPPMSPTPGRSPTTSIPRASLDKELPPPPPGTQASTASKRHTRGESASYSVFSPQDSRQSAKAALTTASTPAPTATTSEKSETNARPNGIDKQDDRALKNSLESARLDGVGDTSNAADTEIITEQLPAVVHDHVTPKVHHIKEERITREIHNHDVFHRIQPIIDVEVLSTKHYVPVPNGNGLVEVSESEIPGRHTKWAVQPVNDKQTISASIQSVANIKTSTRYPEYFSGREALVQDRQKYIKDDGITREETVWRHPPQLEKGAQESGQTVPLTIKQYDDEDMDDYDTASERYAASDPYAGSEQTFSTNADGEEGLLFRDSDLAFDGCLPGLEEANPVVEGNIPGSRPSTATTRKADEVPEGEATKALRRRREAELASKMGQLSVAEN